MRTSLLRNAAGILAIFLAAASAENATKKQVCASQFNDTGLCIQIGDCPLLHTMLLINADNPANKEILRKSQCGYDSTQLTNEKIVLVCCPNKYIDSPDANNSTIQPGNVLPEFGTCGTFLTNRLYGGNLTSIREYPWMALLEYKKPNNTFSFHCAGSLINSHYVLTAAHCVRHSLLPKSWILHSVRLGEWNVSMVPDCETDKSGKKYCAPLHVDIPIERAIVHEEYLLDSVDQFFDIALLRLAHPVPFSEFIRPICLPTTPELRHNYFKGRSLDIAGWGLTEKSVPSEVKLKIAVELWDIDRCQAKYKVFKIAVNGTRQICGGGVADVDTCGGDSGGPMMINERVNDRNVYIAVGIVSYGPEPCALPDWPGVYTHVGHYIDWIRSHLEP